MTAATLSRLPLVAVRGVCRHEALVAPPQVDTGPVDGVAHRRGGDGAQRGDADRAAREHDVQRRAQRLQVEQPDEQPRGGRLGERRPVGMHDDLEVASRWTGVAAHTGTFVRPLVSTSP